MRAPSARPSEERGHRNTPANSPLLCREDPWLQPGCLLGVPTGVLICCSQMDSRTHLRREGGGEAADQRLARSPAVRRRAGEHSVPRPLGPRLHPQLPQRPVPDSLDGVLGQCADLRVDVFDVPGSIHHLFHGRERTGGQCSSLSSVRGDLTWGRALGGHSAGPSVTLGLGGGGWAVPVSLGHSCSAPLLLSPSVPKGTPPSRRPCWGTRPQGPGSSVSPGHTPGPSLATPSAAGTQ